MAQDIVNNNQSISYTNLDFSSIYTETLDLVKKLTYKWDPSISDESDPGVILVKLSALIADKCNYNIDKSILEAFPLSVTQDANAQQLYEQLGYYMNWYKSATVPVVLNWIKSPDTNESEVQSYTIPKFTIITDEGENTNYALIGVEGANGIVVSDGLLTTDSKELRMIAMEGTPATYTYLGQETVITSQMVDTETHRLYFDTPMVSQNGIFITNTKQNNYADWKRVDNIYEQSYNELRYKFGYDNHANSCYLEFPDNYPELFGDGIEIIYMIIDETYNDIPAQALEKFLVPFSPKEDAGVILATNNVSIQNYAAATGHAEKENINEAYENYKKTVGTFHTLITLRDYLNYIKSNDLDICSNAFVCDRTNDVQTVYKIVSKQKSLDSIIVKVEQIIDKTALESNFDYRFQLTNDTLALSGKTYYEIKNDTLTERVFSDNTNPKDLGLYEFVSRVASSHDAMTEFSLRFYLLNNSISLNSKQAFNETFQISTDELDLNYLLSDVAHLEHTYEDILPLGENTYKETEDEVFLKNKAYYRKADDNIHYQLFTEYEIGGSIDSIQNVTIYELDVEALMPHVVFFKNIYPLTVNISTYDSLNSKIQEEIQKNILRALYDGVNSSQVYFGDPISTDYLSNIIVNSDDRIREVSFGSINYYTRAVYYDAQAKEYKEVTLPGSISDVLLDKKTYVPAKGTKFLDGVDYFIKVDNIHYSQYTNYAVGENIPTNLPLYELDYDQKSESKIIGKLIGEDILCKSILSGTTYLLTPDDIFSFHLNQKFINFYENISYITSQAVIDIGGQDVITTYSSDTNNPYVRQSYKLKPNETVSLYRPQLDTIREFSSGIHYECFLYNDIKAGQSYELQDNEYVIFYQSYFSDTAEIGTTKQPDGFSVYACSKGVIISPSFDMASQTNFNSLTTFAKSKITPYFETSTDNWYETQVYTYTYVTEIYNSSSIINNSITGTNTIKLQSIYTVELSPSDNYKFFWVLSTPQYTNDGKLKTFTLFPEYDPSTDLLSDKQKNSYTLKTGEWLYYTDSSYSNLAILGAGTTIYRNCGVTGTFNDDDASQCFHFENINTFGQESSELRYKDGILETITSHSGGFDIMNPYANGFFEYNDETGKYERSVHEVYDPSTNYYVLVMDDNSGLYKLIGDSEPFGHSATTQSSDVFSEVSLSNYLTNVSPKDMGWYEIVSCMNSRVTDYYGLSNGASYNNYLRYTSSVDESILSRKIFTDASYYDIDISDKSTFKNININPTNTTYFDYISQRLLAPKDGYKSYKAYYRDSQGTRITDIKTTDNPSSGWFEEQDGVFVRSQDTTPQLLPDESVLTYPTSLTQNYCFEEVTPTDWSVNPSENGYYYKVDLSDGIYMWDDRRTNISYRVGSNMLSHLISLYSTASQNYTDDYTSIINYIMYNWNTSICGNHPFKLDDKLGWRIPKFKSPEAGDTSTHIAISVTDFATQNMRSALSGANIYLDYSHYHYDSTEGTDVANSAENYRIIIPKSYISVIGDISYEELVEDTNSPLVEIFDRTIPITTGDNQAINASIDEQLCEYCRYLLMAFATSSGIMSVDNLQCYLAVRLYKFKDLYKLTTKQYFTPNYYVTKSFEPVAPWVCEALDNDEVSKDPVNVIGEKKWQTIQPDTSIRIVENEMWSFAEGDILRFEAPVSSQNSLVWPRFSNTEIVLDLNSYSISYQRNGSSIEDLNQLELEGYDWQGYSHLLLNTSTKDGQKLETNHSLVLYSYNELRELTEVTTINGSDYDNVTIQLKTPVDNVAGRYVDVTTEDIYGSDVPNSVYEFVPLTNATGIYTYGSDYTTTAIFNVNLEDGPEEQIGKIIDTQIEIPILLPKGKYILPVYTGTTGVRYWVSKYVEARKDDMRYAVNLSAVPSSDPSLKVRIGHNLDSNQQQYGEHLYGFDKDKYVGLSNSNYYINDTKYHYLDLTVDANPETDDYIKISVPAHLTEYYSNYYNITASPQWFGWYEFDGDNYTLSEDTTTGEDLLEEVIIDTENIVTWSKTHNPAELGWYEQQGAGDDIYYTLSSDTVANKDKTYYKDKDFYISTADTKPPVLKVNADNPLIKLESPSINIIFDDIFKYENNNLYSTELFNELKSKIRRLDDESLYNYAFRIDNNDLITDPLDPKSFFENNHPFNNFTIPQLDFDELDCRFITRNTSRR